MEFWDSLNLPRPERAFSTRGSGNTVRSKITNGLNGQRRRFSGQENYIDVSWEMKASAFARFVAFHQFAINLGSDWFSIPLPIGSAILEGLGLYTQYVNTAVRFVEGKFAFKYVEPVYYRVTAQLEMRARSVISRDLMQTLLDAAIADLPTNYLIVEEDRTFLTAAEPGSDDEMLDDTRLLLLRD